MPEIERKAKNLHDHRLQQAEQARQRRLTASGAARDKDGSSWLTAFVVKAFSEASKFIQSTLLVQESVNWLLQQSDGERLLMKRATFHSKLPQGRRLRRLRSQPFILTTIPENGHQSFQGGSGSEGFKQSLQLHDEESEQSDLFLKLLRPRC